MSKQKVQLQAGAQDSVFVEDVDVSKGVIAAPKDSEGKYYLINKDKLTMVEISSGKEFLKHNTLYDAICHERDCDFFTLSGLRIVTERELTVGDLKTDDLVGFVRSGIKYHIIYNGNGGLIAIGSKKDYYSGMKTPNCIWTGEGKTTVKEVLACQGALITELYRFDTLTGSNSLYEWLNQ